MIKQLIFIPIFSIICLFLAGQENNIKFQNFTKEDGLSNNTVNIVFQDSRGFIWFGTNDGLNRFDGFDFKHYKHNPDDKTSLSNSTIYSIIEDTYSNLWIGTNEGLNRFNPHTEQFKRYYSKKNDTKSLSKNIITALIPDSYGVVWIGTYGGGLNRYNPENNTFDVFVKNESDSLSLLHDKVFSLMYAEGTLWIGNGKGISKLYKENDNIRFKNFHIGHTIWTLEKYDKNLFWAGSLGGGLYAFAPHSGDIMPIDLKTTGLTNITVYSIAVTKDKELWVGTLFGLNKYSHKKERFTNFFNIQDKPESIAGNTIWYIFEDNTQNLWYGTSNGVSFYSQNINHFIHFYHQPDNPASLGNNKVQCFFEDSDGMIWVGTNAGVDMFNPQDKTFRHFKWQENNPYSLSQNFVYAIEEDRNGNLWLGTWGGGLNRLVKHHSIKDSIYFEHFKWDENNSQSICSDYIGYLYKDRKGDIWIGTMKGLTKMKVNKKSKSDELVLEFNSYFHNPQDSNSISDNYINFIYEDTKNNLWIGTKNEGLNLFDHQSGKFIRFKYEYNNSNSLSNNQVTSVFETFDGKLWISTYNGVNMMKIEGEKPNQSNVSFKRFDKSDGLPDDVILGILEDKDGNLWMSSNSGIAQRTNEGDIRVFDKKNGLQGNTFNGHAFYMCRDGRMFFGGNNGFNMFYPDDIEEHKFNPEVVITDFKLLNKHVEVGEKIHDIVVLDKEISFEDEIYLTHHEYNFTFEFAALDYNLPEKLKYAYKMEELDTSWIYTSADKRYATYTDLDPGTYFFNVKATNFDGRWSNNQRRVKVVILPPYWQTMWFRMIVFVVIFLIFFAWYWMYTSNMKRQKRLLEEKVKEKTLEITQKNEILSKKNKKIQNQKNELEEHRKNLEKLVLDRTKQLQLAKDRAEEADNLKTAFLKNMSHEIRTPLNAILGFSSVLMEQDFTKEERKEYYLYLKDSADTLTKLIEDIIDLSRIETGEIKIQEKACDINFLVENIANDYKQKIIANEKENLIFNINSNNFPSDSDILCDPFRIRQIVDNFLANALKYTEDGEIILDYKLKQHDNTNAKARIRFAVKDTGIGIDNDKIKVIFEVFRKISDKRTKLYRGAGLGLAISRKIVEYLNGEIGVNSDQGKGSEFWFEVPVKMVKKIKMDGTKTDSDFSMPENEPPLILIVEDEDVNFRYIETILKTEGFKCIRSTDGQSAIEMFKANADEIVLVLMDINLPELDGYEATRLIKKIKPEVPVIAQTAFALTGEAKTSRDAGCDDYISKPYSARHLIKMIKSLLKKS